jgi:hypothetical protein
MTPTSRLVDELERAGARPRNGHARCPAHDDKHESLTYREADDGRVLVRCHAGCTIEQILAALRLESADLFPPREPKEDRRRIESTYDYTDEQGRLLYQVVRFAGKTFRQRRPAPNGHGSWVWNLQRTRRVPYRLPKLLETAHSGGTIYIAEGEKDVHALEAAGACATCNPGGAGKWQPAYADHLVGASAVVVIADADEPGYAHAQSVARSLAQRQIPHTIVRVRTGKDASDHLAAGHTLADLEPLTEPDLAADLEPDARPDRRITARALCAQPDPAQPPELLGPLLARGERLVLGASTGHGKTTFVARLIAACTRTAEFLGFRGAGGRALVVDAEQSIRDIKRVLREASLDESDDVDYLIVPDGLDLAANTDDISELAGYLDTGNYDLVALDPAYKLHRGESNEERAAVDLMRRLDAWREAYQFGLLLPMHTRKPPAGLPARMSIHELFGSSAYTRGAEVVLGLELLRPGYSRLHVLKHRRGELATGERWGLIYDREDGYRRDPAETDAAETTVEQVRQALRTTPDLDLDALRDVTKSSISSIRSALRELGAIGAKSGRKGRKTWRLGDDTNLFEPLDEAESE